MSNITLDDLAIMIANGFTEQGKRLDKHTEQFASIERSLAMHDQHLNVIRKQQAIHDRKFDEIKEKLGMTDEELIALREEVKQIRLDLTKARTAEDFEAIKQRVTIVERRVGIIPS
jgi:hypothetical protein